MAKYRKRPVVVEAELFEMGMEDGYALYSPNNGAMLGFYTSDFLRNGIKKPAIKTLEGWYEVEVGKHYIVTGIVGERHPVEKEIFEKTYDKVSD